jgi:uroporphyrinogen III methyltransferase/synthase
MEKILENINIVLTRAKDQAVETINLLEKNGANVISFPTIRISTIKDNRELNETIKNINSFNSLVFTSENAVKSFLEKITELGVNFDPKAFFVISIGGKTSQVLLENGFRVDFQSKHFTSEALIEEISLIDLVGRKILVPNSTLSKKNQFGILEKSGAFVEHAAVYTNTINNHESLKNEIDLLYRTEIDVFIFTSPSTFKGFLEILNIKNPIEYFHNKNIAVIGSVTKKALEEFGITPNIMPQNYTMNYLIEKLKEYYKKEKIN